jgi:putative membrane protein
VLKEKGIKAAWEHINGTFLLILFLGIGTSIFSLAKIISHLLETYPILLWSFFFGLIIASVLFIGRQIKTWNASAIVSLLLGTAIAYYITIAAPATAPESLWFVFLSGCIAICAMILPGISGSFILLLLGSYAMVLNGVKDLNILLIAVFLSGCVIGLLSFSHLLSWTFKHYRNATLALLTGFMIGSLNKVWPWKEVLSYRTNSHGEQEAFLEKSILPTQYAEIAQQEPYVLAAIVAMTAGFLLVFLLERSSAKK